MTSIEEDILESSLINAQMPFKNFTRDMQHRTTDFEKHPEYELLNFSP